MGEFWILILGAFFATNLLDKAESVQLFDEIFGEGWWDKDKAKEWHKLTLEHNFLHQIDRQNTQIGQIEPNSTDQLGQIEPNLTHQSPPLTESDHSGQIEPNSTDQNPLLTESDHSKQIDEIFGEGWWDNDKAKEWNKLTLEQNFLHQIDRQNTQLGQIEPNLTDQLGQIETNSTDQNALLTETDHSGQIELNSTDQNPLLTESDQSDNAKDGEEQNEITSSIAEDKQKRKIVAKFVAMKDTFNQKGKYSKKERTKIEQKIAKHLKVSRTKIYKWKKEFGLSQKTLYEKEERKNLIEKFDQMKDELKRAGFKNSYKQEINETVAKKLGVNFRTIYRWKRELGLPWTNYSDDEKLEIVKMLMQMKSEHSGEDKKLCKEIFERFGVNIGTINQWEKEFGLSQKVFYEKEKRKNLVEKFDQMKAELMRDGFKNSYKNELDETVAKELGLSFTTIYKWKSELGQTTANKYAHDNQKELLMKRYYEIKDKNSQIRDKDIAKMLKIGKTTLVRWKKQFKDRNSIQILSILWK